MGGYRLIGHPLGHSMSPQIHERLFALEGRTDSYSLFPFPPDKLETQVPILRGLEGFNITIPYKQAILPLTVCSILRPFTGRLIPSGCRKVG